ncbi:hypothetical protein BX661DRAFT_207736 [Kickxella alabastrina]|uniref:uncharacterized protein n=1 Tax=Kickxella alabastrina TaxID=61397 RepID=UPI00221ECB7B|nr:uncharacterized protein BX661DRAFT_207736 [Kickxella alabastrina]KAI7820713.1 hypothetical protein BX661DRAFT_207736 [Kickxella alabastrina]
MDSNQQQQQQLGEYIVRTLAVGLPAANEPSHQTDSPKAARRPSLTQRLGLNTQQKQKNKGKEVATDDVTDSGDSEEPSLARPNKQQQQKPAKIECVDVAGDNVYMGTSNGHVLHYAVGAVTMENADGAPERQLVRSVSLQLGAKRVEQLLVLPTQAKLAVLCASTLVILDLPQLRPAAGAGMQQLRGVSCIALDERVPRLLAQADAVGLCVARARSVQVYRLGTDAMRLEQEFAVASSVGSLSHYGNFVCLADTETYKIIDLRKLRRGAPADAELILLPTQQPQTDAATGRVARPPRPRTLVAGPNEFMILAASGADASSATLGVIVTALGEARRGTLQFSAYPKSIAYDDPFVIAVFASGRVEVHDTRRPDQTLVQTLSFTDDACDARRPRRLCVAAAAHVAVDAPLLECVDEAVLAIDEAAQPGAVETQFCVQLAAMVCLKRMLLDDALQYFRRGMMDPRALLHLFPAFVRYLGSLLVPFARIPLAADVRALFCDIGDIGTLVRAGAKQLLADSNDDAQIAALADALAANALEVLERYLEFCRAQMQGQPAEGEGAADDGVQRFAPDAVPVIDTALVRLYAINSRHEKLCALIQDPASSLVGDLAADYFASTQQHYYRSLVYKAQGDTRRVLDIWHRLLLCELSDPLFGGLAEYLHYVELTDSQPTMAAEFRWSVAVDVEVSAPLQILRHLSDAFVSRIDADAAFAAIEPHGDEPLRAFIERLVAANHSRATHYMTYLVCVYVRQIRDYYLPDTPEAGIRSLELDSGFRRAQADDLRLTIRSHLARVGATDDGARMRSNLLNVLTARPARYNPALVLECVEKEAPLLLHTERAVLLTALGKQQEAVNALVDDAGDYAEAELLLLMPLAQPSLARVFPQAASNSQSPNGASPENNSVSILFYKYLAVGTDPNGDEDMAARLVADLLSRYPDSLGMHVLADIPGHWPYNITEPFNKWASTCFLSFFNILSIGAIHLESVDRSSQDLRLDLKDPK